MSVRLRTKWLWVRVQLQSLIYDLFIIGHSTALNIFCRWIQFKIVNLFKYIFQIKDLLKITHKRIQVISKEIFSGTQEKVQKMKMQNNPKNYAKLVVTWIMLPRKIAKKIIIKQNPTKMSNTEYNNGSHLLFWVSHSNLVI